VIRRTCSFALQQLVKRSYVGLRHLQRLEFAEFSVITEARHDVPQPVESVIQTVHPPPLSGIGRQPPLPEHLDAGRAALHLLHRRFFGLLAGVFQNVVVVVSLMIPQLIAFARLAARRKANVVSRHGVTGTQIENVCS